MEVARRYRTFLIISVFLVFGQNASSQASVDTLNVLFVGNSYIYFNNLPDMVDAISISVNGDVIRSSSHTHGGFTLGRHVDDAHIPEILSDEKPGAIKWDQIVLQEQSSLGTRWTDSEAGILGDVSGFYASTRRLASTISNHGSSTMLYMTWAKKKFPRQSSAIAAAYDTIGEELSIPVAPVGLAWARVRRERPELSLYSRDGSHPNATGSYLAACVFYVQLTGNSPLGATSEIIGSGWTSSGIVEGEGSSVLVSLSGEIAGYLQEVAYEVVVGRSEAGE
jgi:hypothetical protein